LIEFENERTRHHFLRDLCKEHGFKSLLTENSNREKVDLEGFMEVIPSNQLDSIVKALIRHGKPETFSNK
jgi:hypothetical protein